ncbi:hypothetical protein JCGZ_15211 [Jatropha curcas]|uniref:Uncharacterized protein n=1 Tax=Jatropha curcas TaxID=180498 RepID=A0A067K5P9_JATCU|nr:hypothetical protein JCGZ_15211 [Jatropha curcas]
MKKYEIYSQNRVSETGGPGAGPLRHTGGSISTVEAKWMGHEPTPIEVVKYTHIKDHNLETFVGRHAISINATVDELQLYWEAVGGKKKRKVYGIGSQAAHYNATLRLCLCECFTPAQPDYGEEEIYILRTRLNKQERQLANLIEHVMRMSSTPTATASIDLYASSNPSTPSIIVPAHDLVAAPTLDTS